jgi:type II secretory pathway pseudopilin PulG
MIYQRLRSRISQGGLTLLELLISLGIMSGVVVGITRLMEDAGEDTRASVTALHTRTVGNAASEYVKDNYAAISAVATATSPVLIRVPDLIATGYLPTGFSITNPRQQSTCVLVLEPTPNRLEGLVITEGGDTIDDLTLGQIAATIGGSGGGIYSTAPTTIRGAMGGYSFPVGAYGNPNSLGQRCDGTAGNIAVSAGHPVMSLPYADGAQASSTLYRDAVPGNPSLNTMNTPILMGAGSQQTVGAVCTTPGAIGSSATGAVVACEDGVWKKGGSAFWQDPVATFANLPICNAAALGHTRVVHTPTVGTGRRAYTCDGGGTWVPLAVGDNGNLTVPGEVNAAALNGALLVVPVAVEGAACPVNGRIARTSTGLLLSCNSSVWTGPSGGLRYGQNWQNVSRGFGVWYPNTTGKPIMVAAVANGFSTYAYLVYYLSDGVTQISSLTTCYDTCDATFVVPPNHSYYIGSGGSGVSALSVRELR